MFYIIGSKKERQQFKDENRIPYFSCEEETWDDCSMLHNDREDERLTLYVNLNDGSYCVQVMNEDGMGIESEEKFSTYGEALEAYEALEQ